MHSFLPALGLTLISTVHAHAISHVHIKRDLAVGSLPAKWESLGCYSDSPAARALTSGYTASSDMTEVQCIAYCDQRGYIFAGTSYAEECFCSYTIDNGNEKIDDSRCNMACPGAPETPCGGSNAINIFTNGRSAPVANPGVYDYELIGCYSDSQTARTLSVFQPSSDGIGFVRGCIETCRAHGYSYCGVEFGHECFGSDTLAVTGQQIPEARCNMPCNGNSTEQCGGADAMNLYKYQGSSTISSSTTTTTTTTAAAATTTTSEDATTTSATTTTTTTATTTASTTTTTTTTTTASTCAPTALGVVGNLISNPSFESGLQGWSTGNSPSRLETTAAYAGCNSLMIPSTGSMGFTQIFVTVPITQPLSPGLYYTLRFNFGRTPGANDANPVISGTFAGQRFGQGTGCSADACPLPGSGSSTWQPLAFRAPAGSSGGVQIVFTYTAGSSAPFLLDNFSLVQG